ncbi:MAG: serine/threonine-protein kinase [Polyangiaceae bacterium]
MKPEDPAGAALGPTLMNGPSDPDDPRSLVGQIVADRYEVIELLGVGGMGSVYRARHVHIKKQVALKTLHQAMLRSPEAVARFEREAVAAARISHPNVAVATDFGPLPGGRYYLVLEYIEGRELRSELDAKGALPLARVIHIGRQITSALCAAHQLGIVHRDLKPENVMLVNRGTEIDFVKVLDFGIAKVTVDDETQPLTQFGAVFGTPQYMSPEQGKGQVVDARSDLYTLGVILYEMLTGKLPFEAEDALGFIMQHLGATPTPLSATVPEPLRQLVHGLLEKEPDLRPATANIVLGALDGLATQALVGPSAHDLRAPLRSEARRSVDSAGQAGAQLSTRLRARLGTIDRKILKALLRRGQVGKVSLPVWGWSVAVTALVVFPWMLWPKKTDTAALVPAEKGESKAVAVGSSSLPNLSREEFERELARIELLKVYNRTEQDWMLLARGSAVLAHWEECVGAYRALLSLRKDFRRDGALLADLLAASEDPKAFRIVLNLAETVLGRHGLDLLWEMWERERFLLDRKEQAEKVSKKLVILSRRASPALRTAIELTFTTQCEKLQPVLARAANEADARSLSRLRELESRSGCGTEQKEDCFSCLREPPLLEPALATARKNPAPALGTTAED